MHSYSSTAHRPSGIGGAGGSVPLYAIQLALALGASAVRYLDDDPDALALAAALGAQVSEGPVPLKAGSFGLALSAAVLLFVLWELGKLVARRRSD